MKTRSSADPRGDRQSRDNYVAFHWNRLRGQMVIMGALYGTIHRAGDVAAWNHEESIQFNGINGIFSVS